MILPVLRFLAEQLNQYIIQVRTENNDIEHPVILQNIARLEGDELKNANNLLLSMVNLSEETTMKNNPGYIKRHENEVEYKNPPVDLNLYLLFTACMGNYENALVYLSYVITFFQGKNIFTRQNSSTVIEGLPDDFYIILDMYPLTFELSNYLWSTLGGKQHPFVCYKLRIIRMERESTIESRGIITEVKITGDPGKSVG